jgi:hypothetical protein
VCAATFLPPGAQGSRHWRVKPDHDPNLYSWLLAPKLFPILSEQANGVKQDSGAAGMAGVRFLLKQTDSANHDSNHKADREGMNAANSVDRFKGNHHYCQTPKTGK